MIIDEVCIMNEPLNNDMLAGMPLERLIQPQLLLLLGLKPAHGYELIQRLNEADFTSGEVDAATVYRNLRRMDNDGLVTSHWEAGPSGPGRRLYMITPLGKDTLQAWAEGIRQQIEKLVIFLQVYMQLLETDSNKENSACVEP